MYGLQREPFCNGPMTEVCPLAAGSDFGDFKQFDIAGESRSLRYFGISFECVNQIRQTSYDHELVPFRSSPEGCVYLSEAEEDILKCDTGTELQCCGLKDLSYRNDCLK